MPRLLLLGLLGCAAATGCTEPPSVLVIDVRTDLVPGVEFDEVRTEIVDGPARAPVALAADAEWDGARGFRAAELDGFVRGAVTVRVALSREGEVVLERPVRVALGGAATAVTVLLASACAGVACADGEACLGGDCVPETCTETQTETCPEPMCEAATDCGPASSCAAFECTASGTCFPALDHRACGADGYCAEDAGCVGYAHDLGAGLTSNLLADAGAGIDAAQPGVGGWTYAYLPRATFGVYGPLRASDMDPAAWRPMERARADDRPGWLATDVSGGATVGDRGWVSIAAWEGDWTVANADAIALSPENTVQPVVAWRAPDRGVIDFDAEIRIRDDSPQSDVELHLFVVRPDGPERLAEVYLSGDGGPDANGRSTIAAVRDAPHRLQVDATMEAGDVLAILARIGDDDAFDTAVLRGGFRFTPR